MRLVHTSDWHLGRLFHGTHLTDDQAWALDDLVRLVGDVRPDALLVSGDVYDRAVPPPEAVALLDEVLARIAIDHGTPVVMIAGNHDSPDRLGFGARMMAGQGLHVFGTLGAALDTANGVAPRPVVFEDRHGPVSVVALPFASPTAVREIAGTHGDVDSHDAAFRFLTDATRAALPTGRRSVLMAHAFVAGGLASDSERPLTVGGTEAVNPACFDGFSYTALGHLHAPQRAGADNVRYSGSLLKYSFSEADQPKSVTVVELDDKGACTTEAIELRMRRDVRVLEGSLADILARATPGELAKSADDYVMARLTDRGALLDAMGRIREVYPNCMHIDRSAFLAHSGRRERAAPADHRSRSNEELFGDFLREVTGDPPTDREVEALGEVLSAAERFEREERTP